MEVKEKRVPPTYDPYIDPFLVRFFHRDSTIKALIKTGMIDEARSCIKSKEDLE